MMKDMRQLIIIGGGPAAWAAAVYAGRADLKPLVLTGQNPGGQLMLTTVVENFPGFVKGIDGPLLMNQMREQAEQFGVSIIDDVVTGTELNETGVIVKTAGGNFQAMAVILATGAQARWLNVPGEKELIGKGVSACAVCDAAFFRHKKVIVVGGGDAAMEDALALSRFSDMVTIVHRKEMFRASKVMVEKVAQKKNIQIRWNSTVEKISGTNFVETTEIKNSLTGITETAPIDGVFVAIGHDPATTFVRGVVDLDEKGYVKTGITYPGKLGVETSIFKDGYPTMTNLPGVFAAGDCVDFRYRQASTAAGFGVMAALDAERWLEKK